MEDDDEEGTTGIALQSAERRKTTSVHTSVTVREWYNISVRSRVVDKDAGHSAAGHSAAGEARGEGRGRAHTAA